MSALRFFCNINSANLSPAFILKESGGRGHAYRFAIAVASICLITVMAFVANDIALAQNRRSKYGLGSLPEGAKSSGGVRTELPEIILLVPEDGALTFSARPTVYWYVNSVPEEAIRTTFLGTEMKIKFEQIFMLRNNPHKKAEAKTIFKVPVTSTKLGLYRVTLPPTATLEPGTDLGWKTKLPLARVDANEVVVRMENKPAAMAELSKAKTNLDKARIYERYGYWYDALDAYTKWLEANPKDTVARRERANMIEVGLKDNRNFSVYGQPNLKLLKELQTKIDASTAIDLASLPTKSEDEP